MKIISLKSENIKKLKAVEITPTDNTVVITGKNGQGKSSVLDSILYALGGKDALKNTPKPIREGEDHASIEIDLGQYKVVRTWGKLGTTRLEVFSKEGAKFGSPQSLLDEIVGKIAFDPLEFASMKPEQQKLVLLDVLGITDQINSLQSEYKEIYDERTYTGRDLKNAEGHMNSLVKPTVGVAARVDTGKIITNLREAQSYNSNLEKVLGYIKITRERIDAIKGQLQSLEEDLRLSIKQVEGKKPVDTSEIEKQLLEAEELNKQYDAGVTYSIAQEAVAGHKKDQEELTKKLKEIVDKKEKLIASAKLPIKGLSVTSDGVVYNNLPFAQLSSAEQLRISLAIAMAMNPQLRVMRIMDGSLLDSDNMKVIKDMAKSEDYQIWIEVVGEDKKVGILIENGSIKN